VLQLACLVDFNVSRVATLLTVRGAYAFEQCGSPTSVRAAAASATEPADPQGCTELMCMLQGMMEWSDLGIGVAPSADCVFDTSAFDALAATLQVTPCLAPAGQQDARSCRASLPFMGRAQLSFVTITTASMQLKRKAGGCGVQAAPDKNMQGMRPVGSNQMTGKTSSCLAPGLLDAVRALSRVTEVFCTVRFPQAW
jgi:hypothetical protein